MPKNPKSYGTSGGHPITDELIDKLATEAEAGYPPAALRRRSGRPSMGSAPAAVVPIRLDPELRAAVEKRAADEHSTTSDIIRQAIRSYLDVA